MNGQGWGRRVGRSRAEVGQKSRAEVGNESGAGVVQEGRAREWGRSRAEVR